MKNTLKQCRQCGARREELLFGDSCEKAVCQMAVIAATNGGAPLTAKAKELLDREIAGESLLRTFEQTTQIFYIQRGHKLDFFAFVPGDKPGELVKLWLSGQFYLVMNKGKRIPESVEGGLMVRGHGFNRAQHITETVEAMLGNRFKLHAERL